MQEQNKQLEEILNSFNIAYEQILGEKYKLKEQNSEEDKKLKKKLKKYVIEQTDSNQQASQKLNKMLQQLSKNYQTAAKYANKITELKKTVDQSQKQRDGSIKQKELLMNLQKGFKAKYDEQLKKAQQIEKQQQAKRRKIIQQLQQRIKTIQTRYEQSGKRKVQTFRENQTLKHQVSKLQPHLMASESLYDAQLKKKAIQIEIQMTTLKQKIEMMDNFKGMKVQTLGKMQKTKIQQQKIDQRLKKITDKQDQHKILLAKAHLVFQDYKKAIGVLKNTLPKKQKQALESRTKASKAQLSLKELRKQLNDLDLQIQNQTKQKQVLQTLESNLNKQLEQNK